MSVNKLKDLNDNTYIFKTNAMSIIILQTNISYIYSKSCGPFGRVVFIKHLSQV